jgi:hypothetical protein
MLIPEMIFTGTAFSFCVNSSFMKEKMIRFFPVTEFFKNSSLWKGETFHFFLYLKEKSSKKEADNPAG